MQNNVLSIELEEQDFWGICPAEATPLIKRIYEIRRKNIDELEIEDVRLLVSQNISLFITVKLAISILKDNILAEGYYYEGDLLLTVLRSDKLFWNAHSVLKSELSQIVESNFQKIEDELTVDIFLRIKSAFATFVE